MLRTMSSEQRQAKSKVDSWIKTTSMQPQEAPDSSSLQHPPPSLRRSVSDSDFLDTSKKRTTWPTARGGTESQKTKRGSAQDMSLQELETALKLSEQGLIKLDSQSYHEIQSELMRRNLLKDPGGSLMDSPRLGRVEHNPGEYATPRLRRSSQAGGMGGLRRSNSESDVRSQLAADKHALLEALSGRKQQPQVQSPRPVRMPLHQRGGIGGLHRSNSNSDMTDGVTSELELLMMSRPADMRMQTQQPNPPEPVEPLAEPESGDDDLNLFAGLGQIYGMLGGAAASVTQSLQAPVGVVHR